MFILLFNIKIPFYFYYTSYKKNSLYFKTIFFRNMNLENFRPTIFKRFIIKTNRLEQRSGIEPL